MTRLLPSKTGGLVLVCLVLVSSLIIGGCAKPAEEEAQLSIAKELATLIQQTIEDCETKHGLQVYNLPADERQLWKETVMGVWEDWLSEREAEGTGEEARQILDLLGYE